jgi:hypothetical protein
MVNGSTLFWGIPRAVLLHSTKGFMSIGTEILALRQDKFSSVAALIGALDRLSASNEHLGMRVYIIAELFRG